RQEWRAGPAAGAAGSQSARRLRSCLPFRFSVRAGSGFDRGFAATRLQFRYFQAATGRDRAGAVDALQRIESGPHQVVGIGRALRLGDDVVDAERLEHGAHRAAGDDAGTGDGGTQDHLARAVMADDIVMQRPTLAQRHADHLALGLLARLAMAETDPALLVADHHERCEAEAPAALDHLGHAVDVNQAIDELAIALLYVSHGFSASFEIARQNCRPPSRAASARAFTRP